MVFLNTVVHVHGARLMPEQAGGIQNLPRVVCGGSTSHPHELSSVLPQFQAHTRQQQQAQHRGGFQNAWVSPLSDMTQHSSSGSQNIPPALHIGCWGLGRERVLVEGWGAEKSICGCACTGCERQETHLDSTHTSNQPSGLSSPANHGITLVGKAF